MQPRYAVALMAADGLCHEPRVVQSIAAVRPQIDETAWTGHVGHGRMV